MGCYTFPMVNQRDDGSQNGTTLESAIEICRQRRATSVLSDPLGFAEFDATSARHGVSRRMPVEADLVTRPKQGGGTRVEIFPDLVTSVQLQLAARQISRGTPPQRYEVWCHTIPMWIRHALVEGMSVVVADVDSYFPSVSMSAIERALRRLQLDEENTETTLSAIRAMNEVPDENAETRTGLPVADEELLWLIADVVLRPVDDCLILEPLVTRHIRWVDDFYLAVNTTDVTRALTSLSEALEAQGFRLNEKKTRVFGSISEYERQALTHEHRVVTNLTMIGSRGKLSTLQQSALTELTELDRLSTPEHARLWKRTYALAERLRSPVLIPDALSDLDRYPTAEKQISSYLRALNWPCGTATMAAKRLARAPTDSHAIVLLRALLGAPDALAKSAVVALTDILESIPERMHPYAIVLLQACLMQSQSTHSSSVIVQQMLALTTHSKSPLARRVAIELLWLLPERRPILAKAVRQDTSLTVRGLNALPAIAGIETELSAPYAQKQPVDPTWGPLGSEVQRTWMNT